MFALIENGAVKQYPYSLSEIQRANLNTSFPSTVSDKTMAEYGAMRVYFATQPALSDTQVLVEDTPVFDVNAQRWAQVWQVRDMTTEEVTQRFNSAASAVRQQRDSKLAETDWTQLTDSPVDKAAWATYRQALRDVPTQSGFPWTIDWPVQP
tara:strand:+ start:721 stop:1176 length:456 start_codon:yes stop_codon:yes gene_type:complete